jgi:enolase
VVEIYKILAREILDSRGNPTIEVDVILSDGSIGRAAVPSGASTGSLEAMEIRDNDKARFLGKGVLNAVNNITQIIAPSLIKSSPFSQKELDEKLISLDGTNNKSKLGANAILGVSLAIAKAAAHSKNIPFYQYINSNSLDYKSPKAMMNIINGGAHADNKIDIQEFMIMPNCNNIKDSIRMGAEVFHILKGLLKKDGFNTNVGDEGGFAPNLDSPEQALDYILKAIEKAGYKPGKDISLALDSAATEFYKDGYYTMNEKKYSSSELISYYENLVNNYPIASIEDPMAEDDIEGWKLITKQLKDNAMLVGDDLFVTNAKLLENGIQNNLANSILIKPNQIGTLTETLETVDLAKKSGYSAIISHRSGETEDTSISHIAVATGVGYIKAGSLCRTDRVAKYNELVRIEENL